MIYNNYNFKVPESKVFRVITNTDAKNEADDQYAIVHTLLSPKFDNRGIIAAHFDERKSATSMLDSYEEIKKLLNLMDFPEDLAYKGAETALGVSGAPIESEGAKLIINEAMKEDDRPLYVTFMGPLTDMASAYLMEPRIAKRLTCIWIGGGNYPNGGPEYNMSNDIEAARIVMNSEIPLWQIPRNAYNHVIVSLAELEFKVRPCGELGQYLFEQLAAWGHTPKALTTARTGEYWCLGDSPAIGVMLYPHMYDFQWVQAPYITDQMTYVTNTQNRPIKVFNRIDGRFIMEDFYAKLAMFTDKKH